MNGKDWILRMKGKHSITIFVNGEVRYSIGKMKLFVLKKNALREIESLLRLSLSDTDDSVNGNIIRFKDNNHVYCIKNCRLYTKIWKIIYEASNIEGKPEEVAELADLIDYIIRFGDLLSEVPLAAPDPAYLNNLVDIDVYIESLVNIILTKNNEVYYSL